MRGAYRFVAQLLAAVVILALPLPSMAQTYFDVSYMDVYNDRDTPEVCFSFSADLASQRDVVFEDYVAVTPAATVTATPRGASLCISGLDFGGSYKITLLAGLPGVDGSALEGERYYDVLIQDRPASIGFRGNNGYVLPATQAEGLPLRTVNLEKAQLRLLRINDRNLVQQFARGRLNQSLYDYDVYDLANIEGEEVWSGEIVLPSGEANKAVDTLVPIATIMPEVKPGLYIAIANDPKATNYWEPVASQWFVISDLGIASFRGDSGIKVSVRALSSALPTEGAEVVLLAQNNAELGRAVVDANGLASFDAGLTRGTGGNVPRAVLVYGPAGDFNVMDLGASGLDLVDRGIGGRSIPGPLDAFLYTERGIYRPGEPVFVSALLRDQAANAVEGVPMTFKLWRPDGSEYESWQASDAGGGAFSATIDLPGSARTGLWEISVHADPESYALGRVAFEVEDFVPPQIEFDLSSAQTFATPEGSVSVEVAASYLYGAPAADLPGEFMLLLDAASDPFPSLPGYQFGQATEYFTPLTSTPGAFLTDAEGKAVIDAWPEVLPNSSLPLEASVRVAIFDLGGRPVYRRITVPFDDKPYYIGIKPNFENGYVAENTPAAFQVITTDRMGADVPVEGLRYSVIREDYDYVWYRSNGSWYAEWVSRDSLMAEGEIAVAPGEPGQVEYTPDWGMHRLEVYDQAGTVVSSVHFSGGWWTDPSSDSPDEVEVSLDKETYSVGETARVFIKPPFDAKVLVAIADSGVRSIQAVDVPAAGGFVEIPVTADWTAGVYVLATAYQIGDGGQGGLARRAVGVDWLSLSTADRTLTVTLDTPEMIRPSQTLPVTLTVAGALEGETAYLTLAAVDDGVLQLTGYVPPNPIDYYLGKRELGVTLHDVYGYLINAEGNSVAELRSGGDLEGRNLESLPERSTKVVSLYSGVVQVGAGGTVQVPLEVPDFNGRLRLMAVAWSGSKLGSTDQEMIVRAPLVAEVTLPRFLAPGDVAEAVVALRNVDGEAGDYRIEIATNGVVAVDQPVIEAPRLAPGQEAREGRKLSAEAVGVATLTITVTGPNGYSLVREKKISVRPASPTVSTREVAVLAPGESLTVTPDVAALYMPETASATLAVSSLPDFDVPGLLEALDRYPYGCAEQTVSRAMPLLYVNDVAAALGQGDDASISQRVQEAIYRLNNMQLWGGAYGLWGPWSDPDSWLSSYVLDFLTRAREAGYHVPDAGYQAGLDYLHQVATGWLDTPHNYASYAYAQYVLARAGRGNLSDLRYFYETNWGLLPTPMARAQLSAALAWLGDTQRAEEGFATLFTDSDAAWRPGDYGSNLRDLANAVALMAEGNAVSDQLLLETVDKAGRVFSQSQYFSTQEMSWLLLATHELVKRAGPMTLAVNGEEQPERKTPLYRSIDFAAGEEALTVTNQGQGPLYRVLTVTGVATEPLPAAEQGFTIRRRVFDLNGLPVDLTQMQQGKSYLVLIEGRSHDTDDHQALVADLLPAGWEIENANLGQGAPLEAYPWLGELSWTTFSEARDDRYAAAVNLGYYKNTFRMAYMVRAVTPGSFTVPGVYIEDMYRPDLMARGPVGSAVISAR